MQGSIYEYIAFGCTLPAYYILAVSMQSISNFEQAYVKNIQVDSCQSRRAKN